MKKRIITLPAGARNQPELRPLVRRESPDDDRHARVSERDSLCTSASWRFGDRGEKLACA
jgi:hypothetical protein